MESQYSDLKRGFHFLNTGFSSLSIKRHFVSKRHGEKSFRFKSIHPLIISFISQNLLSTPLFFFILILYVLSLKEKRIFITTSFEKKFCFLNDFLILKTVFPVLIFAFLSVYLDSIIFSRQVFI